MITSDHRGFAGVGLPKKSPPPASIRSSELSYPAQVCPPVSTRLIGADIFLRAGASSPEENTQKDDYLRPPRLRRSSAARNTSSSGQHSLVGVELPGASLSSGEHPPGRRRPPPVIRRSSPAHFAGELLLY